MDLFRFFISARGIYLKRITALVLTLAFAAAFLLLPGEQVVRVYAGDGDSSQSESTPLSITSQPQNVTVDAGETATFRVEATGTGLQYQWYYRKADMSSGAVWNGHTTAVTSANANSTWNLMKVWCVVTDESGASVKSESSVVSLRRQLTFLNQPEDVTVKAGQAAYFRVAAQGTGKVRYQWYYKKSGAQSWSLWKGHTTATTFASANSTWNLMQVYCKVSDESGASVDSEISVVRIEQPLTVLTQPQSISVRTGDRAEFSVSAKGTGAVSYQWYVRKVGSSEDVAWAGHTDATTSATVNSTWNRMKVWCVIRDDSGASVKSDVAEVTLIQPLVILTQPESITAKTGDAAYFRVSAQGTGKVGYQWYYKKYGADDWTLWKGHTTAVTFASANGSWNLMQVYCQLTDQAGASVDSDCVTVKIDQPLTIVTHPASKSVTGGRMAEFKVKAQGMGEYRYQWYSRASADAPWKKMEGQTSSGISFKAEEKMTGMSVRCEISDESGTTVQSDPATLKVIPAIKITSQPVQATIHSGDTAKFSIAAEGVGLTYQWYYKKAGKSDWTLWKGKTQTTVSGVADCTWHVMQVFCRVTDEAGETADSSIAYAMITKKSDKRYIKRTFTVKSSGTKIYSGPGTGNKLLGTLSAGEKYLALEWGSDSGDVTWFRFNWKGKDAWICRKNTNVSDEFVTIPDRSFKDGGVPIIYLSPSRQTKNAYAAGSTTEGVQMYRVGEKLKKILEDEYLCVVYMPPVSMLINLNGRPQDAYDKEADVYLAIHSNAHSTKTRYGAVGYYFPGSEQSKQLGKNMAAEMGKISPFTPNVGTDIVNGMTAFDNIGYGEVRDPAYFGMVSLLAEVEYHDNADSAQWIIDNPDKIARALANALEKTFDIQKRAK